MIVTPGPDPIRWFSGPRSGTVPVPAIEAVDTAGAGDAFHGALAVALAGPTPPTTPRSPSAPPGVTAPSPDFGVADEPGLTDCIAFAARVAGVRVAHAGPRAWLAALHRR